MATPVQTARIVQNEDGSYSLVAASRQPMLVSDIHFEGIEDCSLDELHGELAAIFESNAEEAAAHYLGDLA